MQIGNIGIAMGADPRIKPVLAPYVNALASSFYK